MHPLPGHSAANLCYQFPACNLYSGSTLKHHCENIIISQGIKLTPPLSFLLPTFQYTECILATNPVTDLELIGKHLRQTLLSQLYWDYSYT